MEAPQVQIDTSMGSFTVELYYKHAPRTVKNFVGLSEKGYYDGTLVRAVDDSRGPAECPVLRETTALPSGPCSTQA